MMPAFVADWARSGYGKVTIAEAELNLEAVRKAGMAVTVAAYEPVVAAVGMPIMRVGESVAAINVSMPPEALLSPGETVTICKHLRKEIRVIEERISLEVF
jgi:DNA-binding IclR family transcriptional regulator